jgi:DNA-binding LacI/PurR family transcriptional regulator
MTATALRAPGRLPLRKRRPTIEDVARLAGVSRGTVSRALNGGAHVRPEAMARVNEAVSALGYSVNQAARNLASLRTGSVAFVISERQEHLFSDPNFGTFVRVFSRQLRRLGEHLIVTAAEDYEDEAFLGNYLASGHVDAAIFALPHEHEALLGWLAQSGLPVVVLGRPLGLDTEISCVSVDDEAAAYEATRYLLDQGRTAVATITGPLATSSGRERLAGYRRALAVAPPRRRRAMAARGDWSPQSGRGAARRLLARYPDIDGLFVASDLMALGALGALREAGRRVPEDVAVVGFDDSPAATMADPPLTTVRQPFERLAVEAIRVISELIAGDGHQPQQVVLPTRLVKRRSA